METIATAAILTSASCRSLSPCPEATKGVSSRFSSDSPLVGYLSLFSVLAGGSKSISFECEGIAGDASRDKQEFRPMSTLKLGCFSQVQSDLSADEPVNHVLVQFFTLSLLISTVIIFCSNFIVGVMIKKEIGGSTTPRQSLKLSSARFLLSDKRV